MEFKDKVKSSAPLQERLRVLDQETQKLYLACKDAGYTPEKIRKTARPLLQAARQGQWKAYARSGAIWSVVIGVLLASQWVKPINNVIYAVGKKMMIKVMPYYDWTTLYRYCLIQNPYYKRPNVSLAESDCQVCQNLSKLQLMTKVNSSYMTELLFQMKPTLIGDAMNDWKSMKEPITLEDIIHMYQSNPDLGDNNKLCNLIVTAGLNLTNATLQDLFEKLENEIEEGREGNFTAYWKNCHRDSAKEMHQLYYAPYFLPGMCETERNGNYIFIGRKSANRTKGAIFLGKRHHVTGYWIAQLHGAMVMILAPTSVCKDICPNIKIVLERGQVLNIPSNRLYNFAFRPHTEEAVAIGTSYQF